MKRVIKKLTDSGGGLAISISMLDVISNALAATLILFFTTAALQVQAPLPPQVLGQLVVDVEFVPRQSGAELPILILNPPNGAKRLTDEGINNPSQWHPRNVPKIIDGLPPRSALYEDPANPLHRTIVIYDPLEGEWNLQVLYTNHALYEQEAIGATARVRVWFESSGNGIRVQAQKEVSLLRFTTQRQPFSFTVKALEFQQ
jgi:hypothetical protein